MTQMDMFGYPERPGVARGSDTSRSAADSLDDGVLVGLRAKVFSFIAGRHELGATCDETEVELGLRHQTASARIRELVLRGRIVDSGHRRRTRSGRMAAVYCEQSRNNG